MSPKTVPAEELREGSLVVERDGALLTVTDVEDQGAVLRLELASAMHQGIVAYVKRAARVRVPQ